MRKHKNKLPLITTVGPGGVWMVLFVLLPLLYVLMISLIQMRDRQFVYTFTLDNYKDAFSTLYFSVYANSFLVALLNTVVCILIGYPAGYIIAKAPPMRRNIYTTLLMLPFYINLIIRLNGWNAILSKQGYLNTLLLKIGIIDEPIQFMYTNFAVVLGMAYSLLPFMVLPIISSVSNLDHSLVEASYDLGAGKVKTFFRVILPLTKPGVFAGTIMVFIPTMAYFFISDVMGGAKHKLIGNLIQTQFGQAYNWPLGAAFSVILIVLTMVMVSLYKKSGGKMSGLM